MKRVLSLLSIVLTFSSAVFGQGYIYMTADGPTNPVARLKVTGSAVGSLVLTNIGGVRWGILTVNDTGGGGGGGTTNLFSGTGTTGLVFSASADNTNLFLRGDGTWQEVSNIGTSAVAQVALSGWPTQWAWSSITNAGAVVTNGGNATLGTLNVGTITAGSSLQINGTLTVTGNTYQVTVINISTNVYAGTSTNYVNETIYTTNISSLTIITYTNQVTTNTVDTYVNIGGNFTLGNGASLWATNANINLPTLTITGTLARATETWDWAGATWLNPPTNGWQFGTPGALTNETDPVYTAAASAIITNNDSRFGANIVTAGGATNVANLAASGSGSIAVVNGILQFTPPTVAGLGGVTNAVAYIAGSGATNASATALVLNGFTHTTSGGTSTVTVASSGGSSNQWVDTSAGNVTVTLPTPESTSWFIAKTNAANSLLVVYSGSTNTVSGTANVKAYPIGGAAWQLEW